MKLRSDKACAVMALFVVTSMGARCPADVVYVDAAAPGGGDGEGWETAFDDLAAGLAAGQPGDEVWVARGVYVPAGDRDASFGLRTGVALYGGFAGDEESREERDWVINETILSGDRNGDDGPNFENNDDNSNNVVVASSADGASLDGFTIRGGNADRLGGGLYVEFSDLTIRHCAFRENFSGGDGGGIFAIGGDLLTVEDCLIAGNGATVGGGLHTTMVATVIVTECVFTENFVQRGGGGGGFLIDAWSIEVTGCTFRENTADGTSGGLIAVSLFGATVRDCVFDGNDGGFNVGGLAIVNGTVINCVFSRNSAGFAGGMLASGLVTVVNCTFGQNQGGGIYLDGSDGLTEIFNSIVWGNSGPVIEGSGSDVVRSSNVEGGWSGEGNIDADPLYVQPGTGNLRLAFGSPCVDAGDNDLLPAGIEFDLDGNPRIQNGTVDMGAYEGEHDAQPGRAENEDVDDGETVLLVPNGGGLDPEANTLAVFTNRSGEDDASASLTEYEQNRHPAARGFSSLGTTAVLETSLEDGDFLAAVFIPFGEEDLGGVDPFALDLTYYDKSVGNWALAVGRNTARSPGHRGVFGDRITREGPGSWGVTLEVGDYGVFFNTETRRGFVWANVDHAADFSSGVALCPADAWQPPDSNVDFDDILAVLDNWGEGPGPFDVNDDGTVNIDDLVVVLSNWGGCE